MGATGVAGTREGTKRRAILVMGTARSGTSALTRVLNLLGVELGSELRPAKVGANEKGFFENVAIHRHHVALFAATGPAGGAQAGGAANAGGATNEWDALVERPPRWWAEPALAPIRAALRATIEREFAGAPLFGFKDPELCLLFPLWEELLRELHVEPLPVLIIRHPSEAAASHARLRRAGTQLAHFVWIRTVTAAERATRGRRRAIATFDELLRDWRGTVDRIGKALDVEWPEPIGAKAAAIEEFLDPGLRHHRAPVDPATTGSGKPAASKIEEIARQLHAAFALAASGDERTLPAAVAAAEEAVAAALPMVAPLEADLHGLALRTRELDVERDTARAHGEKMEAKTLALDRELRELKEERVRQKAALAAEHARLAAALDSLGRRREMLRRLRRLWVVRRWRAWRMFLRRRRHARR